MKSMRVGSTRCFEDIVAAVALYRPGPMVRSRLHQTQARALAIDITSPRSSQPLWAYGVQGIDASSAIKGLYSWSADILRRAMGKKKREEMEKQRLILPNAVTTPPESECRKDLRRDGEVRWLRLTRATLPLMRRSPTRPPISSGSIQWLFTALR